MAACEGPPTLIHRPRSNGAVGTLVVVVKHPIPPAEISGLCRRVRRSLVENGPALVVCEVSGSASSDAATVDAMARLQLTARRLGSVVTLVHAPEVLRDLVDLMGLGGVLPDRAGLLLETEGETEQREEARGVEEEADPRDPTV